MTMYLVLLALTSSQTGLTPLMYVSPFVSAVAARDGLPGKQQRSLRGYVLPRTDGQTVAMFCRRRLWHSYK